MKWPFTELGSGMPPGTMMHDQRKKKPKKKRKPRKRKGKR